MWENQYGTPEGFNGYNAQGQTTIEDAYVDGISITYGWKPRNHIWTFAAGDTCPCPPNGIVPPFINASDYFCEREGNGTCNSCFFDNNPLWDGRGCTGSSTCCELNNPPWFCKQLPEPTTEDIEVRLTSYVTGGYNLEDEDTPVQLIEMFVQ